jgi:hypothetical protein
VCRTLRAVCANTEAFPHKLASRFCSRIS